MQSQIPANPLSPHLDSLQKTLQLIFQPHQSQNSSQNSHESPIQHLTIPLDASVTIKSSTQDPNFLKIQYFNLTSEELLPFLNKYIYNPQNNILPFHLHFTDHPIKFKALKTLTDDAKTGPFIRIRSKTDLNEVFYFKVFPIHAQNKFKNALAITQYLQASTSNHEDELPENALDHNLTKLFLSFAGIGRDIISIKKSWFMNLFTKEQLLHETPLYWTISEPNFCDLKTFLTTAKQIKFQIPLYFGWMFLLKFAQILKSLKDLSLAHLNLRPEHVFIQADPKDPWTYYESREECIRVLKRLNFMKIGEFSSAKLIPQDSLQQDFSNEDTARSPYKPTTELINNAQYNPYQVDMYSMGMIMKEIEALMNEKYYGHTFDKNNQDHILQEKTKGLLKELILKMIEPVESRISLEGLYQIIQNHTKILLDHDPTCFNYREKPFSNKEANLIRSVVSQNESEVPVAIFHAFNMKYHHIDESLIKHTKELGFSHIQISPTQKSHEYMAWHDKYQPEDYKVKNRYGSDQDLRKLAERVHKYGLKLIADVVFNHMGSITWFNHITWHRYHNDKKGYMKYRKDLVKAYGRVFKPEGSTNDPNYYFTEWNEDGWMGGSLPQLNTMHPDVKNVQINYLKLLRNLGVDGFRFDAIKTIDKQSLRDYVAAVGDKWLYGEYVSCDVGQNHEFTPLMLFPDFVLLNHLLGVFCLNGSLRNLRVPATNWDPRSVIFAVNHDTWAATKNRRVGINMTFSEESDSDLAALSILARHGGVPLIMKSDTEKARIQAGVKFRREMWNRNAPVEGFNDDVELFEGCNLDTFMIMQRGSEGIFILNKGGEDVKVEKANVSGYWCVPGYYVDAETGKLWKVFESEGRKYLVNEKGVFWVQKRSGVFLIRMNNM